jgi:hypothetical protein
MQTKIIGGGTVVPGVEFGVDPTFNAGRVSIRPFDYALSGQILGHYRASASTAVIAPAANAALLSLRWADPSRYFVLMRASASVTVATAVTPQRTDPISLTIQRGYTASETTNITAVALTNNTGKARVNMGSSLVTQLAVASAAAGISGGTKNSDNTPAATLGLTNLGALGTGFNTDDLVRYDQLGSHPIVLSANEGFTISWGATALATGTATVNFVLTWAEVVTI